MTIYTRHYATYEIQFLRDMDRNGSLPVWMVPHLKLGLQTLIKTMILYGKIRLSSNRKVYLLTEDLRD